MLSGRSLLQPKNVVAPNASGRSLLLPAVRHLPPSATHLQRRAGAEHTAPQHRQSVSPVAAAAAQAGGGGGAARFGQISGPNGFRTLPVLKVPLGPSPNDPSMPLELQMEVMAPEVPCACPVVMWTPGFLLNSSMYRSYAARLASWGYTVVLWDLSEVLDDTLTCAFMKQAIELCTKDSRLRPYCDTNKLVLMGHSRGAKLSCLLADQDPRVQGLVLVDPVDNSSFGPQGVGYPSSLPALSAAASARQLPVLVVGAALNTDVVPPEANWKRFTGAAAAGNSPVWELVLRGSSHLQFLDKQQPLFALFSSNGPTPDEVVRQVTQTAIVAFTQMAIRPSQPYSSSQVQTLLAEEASALQRLAPLDSSFKNFSQLRTSSAGGMGAGAAAGGSSSTSGFDRAPPRQQAGTGRAAAGSAAAAGGGSSRAKPVQASYSQLMNMRVKELKRLLQEHGVDSSDCFEKEELVKRVLDRCTANAQV